MRAQRIVGAFGRGSEPELVIEFGRRRGVGGLADGRGAGDQRAIDATDFAERAGADDLHDAAVGGAIVVDVVPHLGDALVLERGSHHGAAFADGVGERLLDEDVLARLAGVDGGQGVPVVRRGHHHGVEIFALQKLAEIVELLGLVPLRLLDGRGGGIEVRLIEIADRRGDHVGMPHELVEARCSLAARGR